MKTKLRFLLLEDNHADAELIAHELERCGYDFDLALITTESELRRELEADQPDLILSDHGLPSFDGFKALEIVRKANPELPFVFVSGSNDQGMVAQMYDQGATDYVFKHDLADLSAAVREAIESPPLPSPEEIVRPEPPPEKPGFARLWMCPLCLRAWDDQGEAVDFWNYFQCHRELVVQHETCAACQEALLLRLR